MRGQSHRLNNQQISGMPGIKKPAFTLMQMRCLVSAYLCLHIGENLCSFLLAIQILAFSLALNSIFDVWQLQELVRPTIQVWRSLLQTCFEYF